MALNFFLLIFLNVFNLFGSTLIKYNLQNVQTFTTENLQETESLLRDKGVYYCKFILKNNEIDQIIEFYNRESPIEFRAKSAMYHLKNILSKHRVEDCEFLYILGDVFNEKNLSFSSPVFGICKPKGNNKIICMPPFHEIPGFAHINFDKMKEWNEKEEKVFWRGSTSGVYDNYLESPRSKLVTRFLNYQNNFFDIGFNFFTRSIEKPSDAALKDFLDKNSGFKNTCDSYEQSNYKYLIAASGNTYPSSFKWQFGSKSIIINNESEWEEWFYPVLRPWENYVPVKWDFSDLEEIINILQADDQLSRQISINALDVYKNYLHIEAVYEYVAEILNAYSRLKS